MYLLMYLPTYLRIVEQGFVDKVPSTASSAKPNASMTKAAGHLKLLLRYDQVIIHDWETERGR